MCVGSPPSTNMESTSKNYITRRKRSLNEPVPKSKVDWKRTKRDSISHVLDSSEESCSSEEETEGGEDVSSTDESEQEASERLQPSADNGEDDYINKPGYRSRSAIITSSDSSSDSDIPIGNAKIKRRCNIDEEDDKDPDQRGTEETTGDEETEKKKNRTEKLRQLAEKRKSRGRTSNQDSLQVDSGEENSPPHLLLSNESDASDSMSDFIVSDEEEEEEQEPGDGSARCQKLFLKHNISQFACSDLSSHLQRVIKAFLINIVDKSFLTTLYERIRQKKYATDMLKSLNYLDERIIAPRLEKLVTSCRWTNVYKERVSCYPYLTVRTTASDPVFCDACKLRRVCRFLVTLSGQAYDKKTLENDDFLPNDKQLLTVGNTCAQRTEVFHPLQHYKYRLYQRCAPFLDDRVEAPVKTLVDSALSRMEQEHFISKEVNVLEALLNDADYFQEEMLDSLIS